ncbi:hypothetical protein [Lentzea albida]|uniref:Choline monooxygenase n=1 Tax=Lentzea albida TaxID=65499 RepID=A0A1H9PHP7_9PSEU|nr:hypothetical protein [Lentzea albida]SER47379.1 choline monooxygenase [Lentzea albida]
MSTDAAGRILDAVRYLDEVLRQQDIGTVGSVQRGVRTPAFDQGRIAYDPAETGCPDTACTTSTAGLPRGPADGRVLTRHA